MRFLTLAVLPTLTRLAAFYPLEPAKRLTTRSEFVPIYPLLPCTVIQVVSEASAGGAMHRQESLIPPSTTSQKQACWQGRCPGRPPESGEQLLLWSH